MNKHILILKKHQALTKKVPAFTLMEVTVSMLIAAIAIAITYTAAHIVTVTYGDYQKKQDHVAAFSLLDRLLKQDFKRSGKLVKTDNGVQLETTGGLIQYEFADDYVIRDQYTLGTDTFRCDPKAVICTFEKRVVISGETIDQLELQTTLQKEEVPLIYHKTYSAQDLIN